MAARGDNRSLTRLVGERKVQQSQILFRSGDKPINFVMVGVDHHTTPISARESLMTHVSTIDLTKFSGIGKTISEAVLLSTCNRVEIYAVSHDVERTVAELQVLLGTGTEGNRFPINILINEDAARHLFRVAAGIESLVTGEPQILTQLKRAVVDATGDKTSRKVMSGLFTRAVRAGNRARKETSIGSGDVSVGWAAMKLIEEVYTELKGLSLLLVGTGKMIRLIGEELKAKGIARVAIAGRNQQRTSEVSEHLGVRPIETNKLRHLIDDVDIVISATNSELPILRAEDLAQISSNQDRNKLLLIDLAVPRNIDPSVREVDNVKLYNVDDLEPIIESYTRSKSGEVRKVENLIDEEILKFERWHNSMQATPTLKAFREAGEKIRYKETQKGLRLLGDISEHDRRVIQSMTKRIVKALLHTPSLKLKEYAEKGDGELYSDALLDLFELRKPSDERNR